MIKISPLHKQAILRSMGMLGTFLTIPSLLLLTAMVLLGIPNAESVPDVISDLLTTGGYIWALVLIARWFSRRKISLKEATGLNWRNINPKQGAFCAAGGLGMGFSVSALLALLPLPEKWLESYDSASLASFEGRGRVIAILLAVAVFPLCEELFFRGFLLKTLRNGFSSRTSVMITSAVFGLLHGHPLWIAYAFGMGLFFAWMTLRLENLTFTICAHIGFNLSALPGILLGSASGGSRLPVGTVAALAVLLCGAILSGACFWLVFQTDQHSCVASEHSENNNDTISNAR